MSLATALAVPAERLLNRFASPIRPGDSLMAIPSVVAGIDVGPRSSTSGRPGAVPESGADLRDGHRRVGATRRLAGQCGVTTVVMESTGVYWVAAFEHLEYGNSPCIWFILHHRAHAGPGPQDRRARLPVAAALAGSRAAGAGVPTVGGRDAAPGPCFVCGRRSSPTRTSTCSTSQKALTLMNVKLQHVVSDVTGRHGAADHPGHPGGTRRGRLPRLQGWPLQESRRSLRRSLAGPLA